MAGPAILAIDQGTSNTKALLVAKDGEVLLSRTRPTGVSYPRPGWVEQSAAEIWDIVCKLMKETVSAAPEIPVAAIAISNQRETIVVWDAKTGEPVAPAIVWQCRRSESICARLMAEGRAEEIAALSGLGLDPLFPAAKIAWLLDSHPGLRSRAEAGELRCGTVDSWLLWKLTAGAAHATDPSNASRTQLFNLDTLEWDPRLAGIFDVPLRLLPEIQDSDSLFGRTAPDCSALPAGTPIHAIMGDSHAALFAHGIRQPGGVKATIGTGSSLMTPTSQRIASSHGLSSTIAWSRNGAVQQALEGNISVSGQAAAFAASLLGLDDTDAVADLAATVDDNGGVVFVPALVGLGAPYWRSSARGNISGLSLATRPAHVARAAMEAIALQIGDVFSAIEADLGETIPTLSIDGGAARSDMLAQMVSDLLDRNVIRPKMADASPIGAALMAAEACGLSDGGSSAAQSDRFSPSIQPSRREAIRGGWAASIESLLSAAAQPRGKRASD